MRAYVGVVGRWLSFFLPSGFNNSFGVLVVLAPELATSSGLLIG